MFTWKVLICYHAEARGRKHPPQEYGMYEPPRTGSLLQGYVTALSKKSDHRGSQKPSGNRYWRRVWIATPYRVSGVTARYPIHLLHWCVVGCCFFQPCAFADAWVLMRGRAVWQLAGPITRRPQVQVLSPQPCLTADFVRNRRFFVFFGALRKPPGRRLQKWKVVCGEGNK